MMYDNGAQNIESTLPAALVYALRISNLTESILSGW